MNEKDSENRDRSRNDFLIDVCGIDLPDDTSWHNIRTRLSNNQWKWVTHYVIRRVFIKEIAQLKNVPVVAVDCWARRQGGSSGIRDLFRCWKFK